MVRVTVTEPARNFGRYRKLERLRACERRVHRIEELPEDLFEAFMSSRMDPRHDHLNALLDE